MQRLLILGMLMLAPMGWAGEPLATCTDNVSDTCRHEAAKAWVEWALEGRDRVSTRERQHAHETQEACYARMEAAMRMMDEFVPDDVLGTMQWERKFVWEGDAVDVMAYRAEKKKVQPRLERARQRWAEVTHDCWRQP